MASYVHFLDVDATHNIIVFCSYGFRRGIADGKETIALERIWQEKIKRGLKEHRNFYSRGHNKEIGGN